MTLPDGPPARLEGLPALLRPNCRLLVLGSFPGAASLAAQQYYGHPRNHFWPLLRSLLAGDPPWPADGSYAERCDWLLSHGVGLWDVYAACEREGSLDTAIRHAQCNDFAAVARACPGLRVVAHNGGESWRHAPRVQAAFQAAAAGMAFRRLPSSSPANASWSFERKLAAWREVFDPCLGS